MNLIKDHLLIFFLTILLFTYISFKFFSFTISYSYFIFIFDYSKYVRHLSLFTLNSTHIVCYKFPTLNIFIACRVFLKNYFTSSLSIYCISFFFSDDYRLRYNYKNFYSTLNLWAMSKSATKKSTRWIDFLIGFRFLEGDKEFKQLNAYKLTFLQELWSLVLFGFLNYF